MFKDLNKNVVLLSVAQALFLSGNLVSITVVGLAGAMLAPSPILKTLPFALVIVGTALSTIPASLFMKRKSRRAGFFLGAIFGTISFGIAILALTFKIFWLLAFATFIQGVYTAFTSYYRFAAVDTVEPQHASKAISLVLAGGVFAALFAPMIALEYNTYFTTTLYLGSYVFMMTVSLLALLPVFFLDLPNIIVEKNQAGERSLLEIFKNPLAGLAVLNSAVGWFLMVLIMAAAPLAMNSMGFSFFKTSLVIQWHVLAMYLPSFFTGTLIEKFGVSKVILLGYLAFAFAIFFGFLGLQFNNFAFSLMALGVGWNFLFVGGTSLLTRVYSLEEKAKVQGVNEFIVFGIAATSGLMAGPLLDMLEWQGGLKAAVVALSIVVVITFVYGINRKYVRKLS